MKRALCLLRPQLTYRRNSFCSGLRKSGYELCDSISNPGPDDLLLIWNRYSRYDLEAKRFEAGGARVVVAENGYLREGLKGKWFALSIGHHAGAGIWRVGSTDRFNSWNLGLASFRTGGTELIILAQRGIGETGIASPIGWAESVKRKLGGRIRPHPGEHAPSISLFDDLKNAYAVVTWTSTAALQALVMGVPVICAFPSWIGMAASTSLATYERAVWEAERRVEARNGQKINSNWPIEMLYRSEEDRLAMFQRLAWAQWEITEIENGTAFGHLLS